MHRRAFLKLLSVASIPSAVVAQPSAKARTGLVLDPRFAQHVISTRHPESPQRFYALQQAFSAQPEMLALCREMSPWSLNDTEKWLTSIHSEQHITALKHHDETSYQHALLATASMLAAVEAVASGQLRNAFCASRPPGHHAMNTGREEGFCYLNHIAIAARYAQREFALKRVLIVDWDYHHGNGTEWAFYNDDSVLFFSTHDQFAYPGTGDPRRQGEGAGKGFNINVHLPCDTKDKQILAAFEQSLLPAARQFKPDLILISAGFDSRQDDLLGCFNVTDEGFARLTRLVTALADEFCEGRVVSLLEGGYNTAGTASAACTHVNELILAAAKF